MEPSSCNKDTGGYKTLHSWSRGVFFVVSAGGHIEYWQPIYRFAFLKNYVYCLHRWITAICLVAGGVKG